MGNLQYRSSTFHLQTKWTDSELTPYISKQKYPENASGSVNQH